MDTQPEANETVHTAGTNPGNPANPANPGKLSPAGNLPGQPPRFRSDGEPFLVSGPALPPDATGIPSPDTDTPVAGQ